MKSRSLILGLLGILLFSCDAANTADRQFSVFVSIPIQNELTDHVKSIVTTELQKLPGIKLVDKMVNRNGQSVFSVVAVPFKLPSRVAVGVVLSYVFQNSDQIVHGVLTGSADDLENLCEELVSIFDIRLVDPNRRN